MNDTRKNHMMAELPFDEKQLSQLVDGELTADPLNDVLLLVLEDERARHRLHELLLLRQKLRPWREQSLQVKCAPLSAATRLPRRDGPQQQPTNSKWPRVSQLITAAVLGGVLVLGTMLAVQKSTEKPQPAGLVVSAESDIHHEESPDIQAGVSSEQQRQVAEVFAFYESVAGPLKSYVDNEGTITMETLPGEATKQPTPSGDPIAIVIRFSDPARPSGQQTESLVVVRENAPLKISLPNLHNQQQPDVYILPTRTQGAINVRYAISMPNKSDESSASVAGWKNVGLQETSLGGLALGDSSVQITASAWAIK
jgi:hypothetical protein